MEIIPIRENQWFLGSLQASVQILMFIFFAGLQEKK